MWIILPLLIIGIVAAASSSAPRGDYAPQYAWAPPMPAMPPGPIAVLDEYVRIGRPPPPPVILCAIAEAEAMGRNDLANDIVRAFIAPVVYEHQGRARGVRHMPQLPPPRPPMLQAPEIHDMRASRARAPAPPRLASRPVESFVSDEEIHAAMNANPAEFVARAARPAAPILRAREIEIPAPVPIVVAGDFDTQPGSSFDLEYPPGSLLGVQVQNGVRPSPIDGIDPIDWSKFCDRLARETPLYTSSRHVGQYRQRKDRLAELGIDPRSVLGSADAQRAALDRDLTDAYHHVIESGLAADHVGRLIAVPGHDDSYTVTLSGVLGVIQSAGLDGAAGWLESQSDRKRYPHTTQAFLKTNGVF